MKCDSPPRADLAASFFTGLQKVRGVMRLDCRRSCLLRLKQRAGSVPKTVHALMYIIGALHQKCTFSMSPSFDQ